MGEPYRDGGGRAYTSLIREPVFVYGATLEELRRTHQRVAVARAGAGDLYRADVHHHQRCRQPRRRGGSAVDALDFVGIGVHGPRKIDRQDRERAEVPVLGAQERLTWADTQRQPSGCRCQSSVYQPAPCEPSGFL